MRCRSCASAAQIGKKSSAQRCSNETQTTSSEGNARTVADDQRGNCERLAGRIEKKGEYYFTNFPRAPLRLALLDHPMSPYAPGEGGRYFSPAHEGSVTN